MLMVSRVEVSMVKVDLDVVALEVGKWKAVAFEVVGVVGAVVEEVVLDGEAREAVGLEVGTVEVGSEETVLGIVWEAEN